MAHASRRPGPGRFARRSTTNFLLPAALWREQHGERQGKSRGGTVHRCADETWRRFPAPECPQAECGLSLPHAHNRSAEAPTRTISLRSRKALKQLTPSQQLICRARRFGLAGSVTVRLRRSPFRQIKGVYPEIGNSRNSAACRRACESLVSQSMRWTPRRREWTPDTAA